MGQTCLTVCLRTEGLMFVPRAFCLRRLQLRTPPGPLHPSVLQQWHDLDDLADPSFHQTSDIDVLLGADVYSRLIRPGLVRRDEITAQNTALGWTLAGRAPALSPAPSSAIAACSTAHDIEPVWHRDLVALLQRFWEIEDVPTSARTSPADTECEALFATHQRRADGHYVVRLPIKDGSLSLLGDSLSRALSSLSSLQRRLERNSAMKSDYASFMAEYEALGHMRRLSDLELTQASIGPVHYLTHHGIYQEGDHRKKMRVVFNASLPTSSGYCLNDVLHTGPKLQDSLASVLIRWRRHKIAFCTDMQMMFRQVFIDQRDVDLQRIVWSADPDAPPVHYQLLTVTYGASCSPYLALRVLRQLCEDEGHLWPDAASAIMNNRYADDILSGAGDIDTACRLRDQLSRLLLRGGFPLRKWIANTPELLADVPEEARLRSTWHQVSTDGPVSELGVQWDPIADQLRLPIVDLRLHRTKRTILADFARLFDPCGWMAPVFLVGKFLIQDFWRAGLSWDEVIPTSMLDRWSSFIASLQSVSTSAIPRWIGSSSGSTLELHAFSDASRRAMAAVVYSRLSTPDGLTRTDILLAKTKLAPIRSLRPSSTTAARMTIPRLELRAALLATKLLLSVAKDLDISLDRCRVWTDSQVVLHWIRSSDPTGNSLIDNYVAHIQELVPPSIWGYVRSGSNPADIATRGTDSNDLGSQSTWWNGPHWLVDAPVSWPAEESELADLSRRAPACHTVACCTLQEVPTFLDKFSSLDRLLHFLVRLRRWARSRLARGPTRPVLAPLTVDELKEAFAACVRLSQAHTFSAELTHLRAKDDTDNSLPKRNPLSRLAANLTEDGIIRVGGRLHHSNLSEDEKHPPIISGKCPLANLVIRWAHLRALHGGLRVTSAYTAQRAWIIGGPRAIKARLRECVVCARRQARPASQLMAPLPPARVTPARAFLRTGLDYAGPFRVLTSKGRGIRTTKAYICIFVCLATKALHIELVGDLTTQSFLGALTRFCGRRGRPAEIWSDNGTNLRGADLVLREALKASELSWDLVSGSLADQGITWHFIPPGAPHFGGLWEAGVKSAKEHLRRVLGPRSLTYEEFNTVLVSVESVLNSRPLTSLTGELDDLDVLTPGHFLTGGSPTAVIEPSSAPEQLDLLTHWKLVKGIRDRFWIQWSREYLHTLQQRSKWFTRRRNFAVGDLVVVIDATLLQSSGRWPLRRVLRVHPGPDNLVRAATVKTAFGEYVRPITKLALLPLSSVSSSPPDTTPTDHAADI